MKKVLSLLLATLMLMSVFLFVACDYEIPDDIEASKNLEFEKVWGGYKVTGIGKCEDSEVVIPSYHNKKKVIEIDDYAFKDCTQIIKIAIPSTVKKIGDQAFTGCSNLQGVYIDKGIEKLGAMLFYMSSLENIYFNGTVEAFQEIDGGVNYNAWYYVGADYGDKTYYVYCSDGVISYDFRGTNTVAYYEKASKGLDYTLNSDGESYSVSGIGTCADVTIIIPSLFNGKSVTSIGDMAFYGCSSLTRVIIPNSVTDIGEQAFWGCTNLSNIVLPESLTTIKSWAFSDCYALRSITIPKSVNNIGTGVFNFCKTLININVDIDNQHYKSINGILYTKDSKTILQYAPGKIEKSFIIPSYVTTIAMHSFVGCNSLETLIISDQVTNINQYAIGECYNLTNITIGKGVKNIGVCAIFNNMSIKSCSIVYKGTVSQWESINKETDEYGYKWDTMLRYTLSCTDGTIAEDGTVTYK